jgi:hypothetical protein
MTSMDLFMSSDNLSDLPPDRPSPRIESGRSGDRRWWKVAGDRVELEPVASGWTARVRREDWDGVSLEVNGRFDDEAKAVSWCEKMAGVLLRELEEEQDD